MTVGTNFNAVPAYDGGPQRQDPATRTETDHFTNWAQGWRGGEVSSARSEASTMEVRSVRTPQPARERIGIPLLYSSSLVLR